MPDIGTVQHPIAFDIVDEGELPSLADVASSLWPDREVPSDAPDSGNEEFVQIAEDAGWDRLSVRETLLDCAQEFLPHVTDPPLIDHQGFLSMPVITKFLWGRQPERTAPRQPFLIKCFATHSPHLGTVDLATSTTKTRAHQFGLWMAGSSFTRRRKVSVTITLDTHPMSACTEYFVVVDATPKYYSSTSEWELDDITKTGQKWVTLDPCPYCTLHPDEVDDPPFQKDPFEDYTEFRGNPSRGSQIVWEKSSQWKVRVPIPHVPGFASAELGSTSTMTWNLDYTFAGGCKYQPYQERSLVGKMPYMWAYESGGGDIGPTMSGDPIE